MLSASKTDRDFYAVRPELVLRAAKVFGISSSMLDKGAKTLHGRAVAILAGKEACQWGRHQRPVIQQFCNYTQSGGSTYVLPWQELVEHSARYDGREGISTRTGNKPLSTVVRLLVDADALQRAREVTGLGVKEFAEANKMPPLFLVAMESGDWPEVAESTAAVIAHGLGVPATKLFLEINIAASEVASLTNSGSGVGRLQRYKYPIGAAMTIALGAAGYTVLYKGPPSGPVSTEKEVKESEAIPQLVGCWQWSNGMQIVVTDDAIAKNGFGAGPWSLTGDNQYRIEWPDWTADISLSRDGQQLLSSDMFGVESTANRIQGNRHDFVGMWRWDNGGVVNILPEGQATLAYFEGRWSKHDHGYQLSWPIHDEIVVAADGNSLSGRNQFGAFTATRDFGCWETEIDEQD